MVRKIIICIDGVIVIKSDDRYELVSGVRQALIELKKRYETIGIMDDEPSLGAFVDQSGLRSLFATVITRSGGVFAKEFVSTLSPRNDVLVSDKSELIVWGQNKGLITFAMCHDKSRCEELRADFPDFSIRQFTHFIEWMEMLDMPKINKILGIHPTTKGQHYVPNHFLKSWCTEESDIVSVNTKGKIHPARTEDIAKESGIYSLEHLTVDEWKVAVPILKQVAFEGEQPISAAILDFIIYTGILYEYAHKRFNYNDLTKISSVLHAEGLISKECTESLALLMRLAALDADINYLKRAIKRRFIEGFEPIMCLVEQDGFPVIDRIRKNDLTFWGDNEETASLLRYIAYQSVRTRKFEVIVNKRNELLPKVMKLLRPIYAERFTKGLFSKNNWYVATVENSTRLEFITGDCPLFNLALHDKPKYFDLFFPVSKRMAFFMCEKGRERLYPEMSDLKVKDVHALNQQLSRQCISQVYASSEEILTIGKYRASFNVDAFGQRAI